MTVHLDHELGRQLKVQVQVYGQQGVLGRRVGLHCEGDRHRDSEIVLLVIHIDPVAKESPLSTLADDHDAGIV
ncbi:hypothetical protein D3C87_1539140 [compost metagenome]